MKNKLILLSSLLLAVSADCWAQAVPKDPDNFTEYFAGIMRRESGQAQVTVKAPLTLSVGASDVRIDKVYGFCQAKPQDCEKASAFYARNVAEALKQQNAPVDRASVRLVIRPASYIAHAQAQLGVEGPQLQFRPFVDGWLIVAVLDTPSAVRPLDHRDLKKLGLSQDELFTLGEHNLQASLPPLATVAKPVSSGQIGSLNGNFYEVSRVALQAQWAELDAAQHGTLIVALPTSDQVLYISSSTAQATDALRTLSKHTAAASGDAFAPTMLLRWTAQGWKLLPGG